MYTRLCHDCGLPLSDCRLHGASPQPSPLQFMHERQKVSMQLFQAKNAGYIYSIRPTLNLVSRSQKMDTLDVLERTVKEARDSTFASGENRLSSRTQCRFPLIQDGDCKACVIDGIDSVMEEPLPNRQWSISKIPPHVHEVDERVYTPRLVSVGPFHYKRPGLEFMEAQKLRFLDRLLERSGRHLLLDALLDSLRELEATARESYSEDFKHIDSDGFTNMMLLDGCFVIELLRLSGRSRQGKLADDPIFATRWMPFNLAQDLLLLENQLPLSVLQKIFDLTSSGDEKDSLNSLALQFFKPLRPGKDTVAIEEPDADGKFPHLLALFHASFTPTNHRHLPAQEGRSYSYNTYAGKGWLYSAKLLNLSGLTFKKKSGNILEVEFKNRVLEIPTIFIDDTTSIVLRNLVAYEQNNRRAKPYFTSLIVFLSNILCKPEDARLLMRAGIIRQAENDDEAVVRFFNTLVKELVFDMDRCYLGKLIEDVNTSSQSVWAKFRSFCLPILPRLHLLEIALFNISLVQTVVLIKEYPPFS